jgi:arylsulfatase A-like enzyme
MFTGRYPSFHGAGSDPGGRPLAPGAVTLAEVLAGAGYDTAAVVGGTGLGREIGLAQGFAVYHGVPGGHGGPDAAGAVDAARSLLAAMEEPWLLWLHLHGSDGEPETWLDELAAAAPSERTLLIVTAGRGPVAGVEGSRPDRGGAIELDRVRVPLLLAGPGVLPGLVVEPPVSTAAIFATVLDAAGLAPPADLPRPPPVTSLMPLADRRRASGPAVFVESATEVGVARGDAFLVRERVAAADLGPPGGPRAGGAAGAVRRAPGRQPIPLAGSHVPVAVERELAELLDAFERGAAAARDGVGTRPR